MKTNPSALPSDTNAPDAVPQPIEDLVEDLAQQDVLPAQDADGDDSGELHASGLDETGSWNETVESHGHRASKLPLDDETNYAELLVEDGLEEADEELRELDEDEEEEELEEDQSDS